MTFQPKIVCQTLLADDCRTKPLESRKRNISSIAELGTDIELIFNNLSDVLLVLTDIDFINCRIVERFMNGKT